MREKEARLELIRSHWADAPPGRHVWNHPLTSELINRRIGGHSKIHWHDAIKREFFADRKFSKVLCIGCGTGHLERSLFQHGYFENGVGLELSTRALVTARVEAQAIGMPFNYVDCDLDEGLPSEICTGDYDLVLAEASLHHIQNLEPLLFQINRQMVKGGYFMFSEYGGPPRFQWTDEQLRLCNAILATLPESLTQGRNVLQRPTYTDFMTQDPGEAAHGRDILDVFRLFFSVDVERNTCAGITHPALNPLFNNFDDSNELHQTILKLIYLFDETLVDLGAIPSDKFVIGRPRMDV